MKGAEVTLCFDAACERPVRLASVGRIGNGAFRAAESGDWFALDGSPRNGGKLYARPTRPEDRELLARRGEARVLLHNVEQKVRALADLAKLIGSARSAHGLAFREARRAALEAEAIDPAAAGESARLKAEAEASAAIERLRGVSASRGEEAARQLREVERLGREVAAVEAWLEALPEDVKACRKLGDAEALRQYLSAV